MASASPEANRSMREHASMAASGMTNPCPSGGRAQQRLGEVEPPRALLSFGIDFPTGQGDGRDLAGTHDVTPEIVGEVAVADFPTFVGGDGEVLVSLREGFIIDRL